MFDQMLCLVGENPLPVYLGIAGLCTQGGEVWLMHSADTRRHAVAVQKKLGSRWRCPAQTRVQVNPFSPQDVVRGTAQVSTGRPGLALNFTGGTKVMSAFALQAHVNAQPGDHRLGRAFYLEDRGHVFRFCDGADLPFPPALKLNVRDLVELHGGSITDSNMWAPCTTADLQHMWDHFHADKLRALYAVAQREDKVYDSLAGQFDAATQSWRDGEWARFLDRFCEGSPQHPWRRVGLPERTGFGSWQEGWYSELHHQWRFATGGWLELLVGYLVRCAIEGRKPEFGPDRLDLGREVVTGAQIQWNREPFEADLLLVRDNRLRLISATCQRDQRTARLKMFEAIHRARQAGGGLAAASTATLLRRPVDVQHCQSAVDPQGRHRFYGRTDIADWMAGKRLDALRADLSG